MSDRMLRGWEQGFLPVPRGKRSLFCSIRRLRDFARASSVRNTRCDEVGYELEDDEEPKNRFIQRPYPTVPLVVDNQPKATKTRRKSAKSAE